MWTETTRAQYRREDLRYASDMTDTEWALIEPHMPAPKGLGRPRIVPLRGVVDALLYILRTACPWRLLPRDFPKPLDRAALFLHVAEGRSVGAGQFPAGPAFSGTGRPRGQPLGWRDRQPVGQNHGEWWPAGL